MAKLFTYITENESFSEAKIFELDQSDQAIGLLDMIGPPEPIPPEPTPLRAGEDPKPPSVDQILHSYIGVGNVLRFIHGDIVTQPTKLGLNSDVCYYKELDASCAPVNEEALNVILVEEPNGPPVATNPHGFAQTVGGDLLYISDYDSTKIWLLDYEALANPDTTTDPGNPFVIINGIDIPVGNGPKDILPELDPDYQYHGNGITVIQDTEDDGAWYLFALFIASNNVPTQADPREPPEPYLESQLVRIKLDSQGNAVRIDKAIAVGRNAVDMDVTDDENGNPVLLITAIGGPQKEDDTNEIYSMITKVENLFTTLDTTPLLIGDVAPYRGDFRCLTVGNDGRVRILIGYFGPSYTGFNWAVYEGDKDALLGLENETISGAVKKNILTEIGGDTCAPGFFWGIMSGGGRLILIKGSEMVITDETDPYLNASVPGKNVIFGRGTGTGNIGDVNMNSLNFTWATMQQILQQQLAGEGLLHHRDHHHRRHHHIRHLAIQAMQAALAAGAGGGASEESGGN
jgi:hypothetical protein